MAKEYQISVRGVSHTLKREFKIAAKLANRSVNGTVIEAMNQYLDEWKKSTPDAFGKKSKAKQ